MKTLTMDTLNDRYDNFNLFDFQMGMATSVVTLGLQLFFTSFFPTFAWLGYGVQLYYGGPPLTLFAIFSKIGMEVYH